MVYKLIEEEGDYVDIFTGEPRNMLSANWADTPEGMNVGWSEFESDNIAMNTFNIKRTEIIDNIFINHSFFYGWYDGVFICVC